MTISLTTTLPPVEDEACRLDALHALQLLDTDRERLFDQIVDIATTFLDVPIALFSLVDECRQWFKASSGLDVSETPRDVSFCTIAIQQADRLLVPDAQRDPRFAENPLVVGPPHIRFYLGIPIRTRGGYAIGTLCCIDTKPRDFTPRQVAALEKLAQMVTQEIHTREDMIEARARAGRMEHDLRRSQGRFEAIFERANIGIAIVGPNGRFMQVNPALCEIVGYSQGELLTLTFQDITHPDDLHADLALVEQLTAGQIDRYQLEKRYRHRLGYDTWINLHVSVQRTDDAVDYFVAIIESIDVQKAAQRELSLFQETLEERIAERTRELEDANFMLRNAINRQLYAEDELRQREAELRSVIQHANDAYISMDRHGIVRAWNLKAEEIFGWQASEAIGVHLDRLIIPKELKQAHQIGLGRYLSSGNATVIGKRLELPAVRKNGTVLTVEVRIQVIDTGDEPFFGAFLHDISERKAAEAQREHAIHHDALTGLPNRRAFSASLAATQARAARQGFAVALLFVDLDGFKTINDSHGHDAGDALLRIVAERMRGTLRETDQVFRLAGDEFTVLAECRRTSLSDVNLIAQKIIGAISEPVTIGEIVVQVGASIGIAVDAQGNIAPDELVKQADFWMYEAKRAGRGTVRPALR